MLNLRHVIFQVLVVDRELLHLDVNLAAINEKHHKAVFALTDDNVSRQEEKNVQMAYNKTDLNGAALL